MNHQSFRRAKEIEKERATVVEALGKAGNLHIKEYQAPAIEAALKYASIEEKRQIEELLCDILRNKADKLEKEFENL